MSADEVAVLQQVVIAKAAESNAQVNTQVAAESRGEGGPESRGRRRWSRRRPSESEATDNTDQPGTGRTSTARNPQQHSFRGFNIANGVHDDAVSLPGSEYQSSAKSPHSSKAAKSSSKSKKSRKSKDRAPGKGEEFELDGLNDVEEQKEAPKFYYKRRFWTLQLPFAWSLLFGFIGVMLRVFSPFRVGLEEEIEFDMPFSMLCAVLQSLPVASFVNVSMEILQEAASHVQLWRFFLFLAFLPPIYVIADYILLAVVWFFETQFFTTTNVLYFVIALKSPGRYVLMSLLLLPLYIPLFLPQSTLSSGANTAYHRVLSFIACLIVFNSMNFLKVLFAKLMSSYFHSSTHFMKMQEALDKEYYLKVLSTPRQDGNTFVDMLKPEGDADGGHIAQKPSMLSKTAPGRFVSKMGLATSLKKMPMLMRKASSLPRALSLDNLAGQAGSQGGVQQQAAQEDLPSQTQPVSLTIPESTARRSSFEPPDPVPPTPHDAGVESSPAPPSPVAYLSKASVPMAGPSAGSTARSNSGNRRNAPIVRFQQSMSLHKKESG